MINGLLEEPPRHVFSNFRTNQRVLKRKIESDASKSKWTVASSDFTRCSSLLYKKKSVKAFTASLLQKNLKIDSGPLFELHPVEGFKPDFLSSVAGCKPKHFRQLSSEENELNRKKIIPAKHLRTGSVFLEVQNIQNLFQRKSSEEKPLVELPLELCKKFKNDIFNCGAKRGDKSRKVLSEDAVAQIKSYCKSNNGFKQTENAIVKVTSSSDSNLVFEAESKTESQKMLLENDVAQIKSHCKSNKYKKAENTTTDVTSSNDSNLFVKAKSSIEHFKTPSLNTRDITFNSYNTGNKLNSNTNGKLFKAIGFSKIVLGDSEPCLSKECNEQIKHQFVNKDLLDVTDNNTDKSLLKNVLSNSKDLQEHFRFPLTVEHGLHTPNANKKLKDELTTDKQSTKSIGFKNSFAQCKSNNLSPEVKINSGIENTPKKIKLEKCTFTFQPDLLLMDAACKVKKVSVSHLAAGNGTTKDLESEIAEKSADFAVNLALVSANNQEECQPVQFNCDIKSSFQNDSSVKLESSRCEISMVDFSKLLESKCDGSKGSDWMQNLKPAEDKLEVYKQEPAKKKLRNILPGGLAERIFKLQRREHSEKVIWNHKIHRDKRRAQSDSLCLRLISASITEDFVMGKASFTQLEKSHNLVGTDGNTVEQDSSLHFGDTKLLLSSQISRTFKEDFDLDVVAILFKRKAFDKLQLKVNDVFQLHQPWQIISATQIPHPVILCAYFIDIVSFTHDQDASADNLPVIDKEPLLLPKPSIQPESDAQGDLLFFKRNELVTFSARIQRVWKKIFKPTPPHGITLESSCLRYSVLLQIKEKTFHELRIYPGTLCKPWYDVIYQGEGKCFRFHNLQVTNRTSLKRNKQLQAILRNFQLQNGYDLKQEFIYQLMFDNSSKSPEVISSENFLKYCPVKVNTLNNISKVKTPDRFSSIAKVLLNHQGTFYVSDNSLLNSLNPKYTKVQLLSSSEIRMSLKELTVIIKEAIVEEGSLLLDNYSQLIPLNEAAHVDQQLFSINESEIERIQTDVCLTNIVPLLNGQTQIEDIVFVKGVVINADESAALTWMQCSFCLQENLVQDSNLVIYCEDCSCVVPCPILSVKLEVTICLHHLPSAIVNIQLLSSTTKTILEIPEGTYQPQCSVSDILGKDIGPLCCFVLSREEPNRKTIFHLSEILTQ